MKQKIVIEVKMEDAKKRSKALKVAVGFPGVTSASVVPDKNQIVIIGEIDSIELATSLKKKMGFASLSSVAPVEEKKEEKKETKVEAAAPAMIMQPMQWTYNGSLPQYSYYYEQPRYQDPCSIM